MSANNATFFLKKTMELFCNCKKVRPNPKKPQDNSKTTPEKK